MIAATVSGKSTRPDNFAGCRDRSEALRLLSFATGGALTFYFTDAPQLVRPLLNGEASVSALVTENAESIHRERAFCWNERPGLTPIGRMHRDITVCHLDLRAGSL